MEDENVEEGIQQEDAIWGDTGGVQEDRLCVCVSQEEGMG